MDDGWWTSLSEAAIPSLSLPFNSYSSFGLSPNYQFVESKCSGGRGGRSKNRLKTAASQTWLGARITCRES